MKDSDRTLILHISNPPKLFNFTWQLQVFRFFSVYDLSL